MAKVKVTQVRSMIKRPERQRLVLAALGLGRINQSVEVEYSDQIRGMVAKVSHLVSVEQL